MLSLCARRLGSILNGRCHPPIKVATVNRFGRDRLNALACGERHPTGAEKLELASMSGGFLPRDGWRAQPELRV
jgi:hypothetical protein